MIKKYLYYRRRVIFAFAAFAAVFAVSFILYRLPVRAVMYPAALCLVIAVLAAAADLIRVKRAHEKMENIKKLTYDMIGELPEPQSFSEEDYAEIVQLLKDNIREINDAGALKYRETVDYYTVWVHQIKTPIASMRLSLEGEDSPLSRRLSAELSRIEMYVEMVLAYLRLDSETSDYVFKEQDVDRIMRGAIKRFAPEFILKKLTLSYEPTGIRAVTDEKWLGFVFEQILSNSLKYTREGGVTVSSPEEGVLSVKDTGIGVSPEDLPRIFEKGFTGINGRADRKASGLGLYLCKRVCAGLGVKISARSQVGQGTEILLDFKQYRIRGD